MQHRLKGLSGFTRARVLAAKFLDQFYLAVNHPVTALDSSLAGDTPCDAYSSAQKLT